LRTDIGADMPGWQRSLGHRLGSLPQIDMRSDFQGYFLLTNAFETSRAHSMKRPTTGLKVRYFNVMIVTRNERGGTSTGNIFKRYSSLSERNRDFGTTVMNRPRDANFARRSTE